MGDQALLSRARLLQLGAAIAVGARAASAAGAAGGKTQVSEVAAAAARSPLGPRYLRLASYLPLVGSAFTIHRPDKRPVPVRLVSATPLSSEGTVFSLIFRAPRNARFSQLTYRLEHRRLGSYPLFLVPVGPDRNEQILQAVVNRLAE